MRANAQLTKSECVCIHVKSRLCELMLSNACVYRECKTVYMLYCACEPISLKLCSVASDAIVRHVFMMGLLCHGLYTCKLCLDNLMHANWLSIQVMSVYSTNKSN